MTKRIRKRCKDT